MRDICTTINNKKYFKNNRKKGREGGQEGTGLRVTRRPRRPGRQRLEGLVSSLCRVWHRLLRRYFLIPLSPREASIVTGTAQGTGVGLVAQQVHTERSRFIPEPGRPGNTACFATAAPEGTAGPVDSRLGMWVSRAHGGRWAAQRHFLPKSIPSEPYGI